MANWYGQSRSNYVRLDPVKKDLLADIFPVKIIEKHDEPGLYAMFSNTEFGDLPTTMTVSAPKLAALGIDVTALLPEESAEDLQDEEIEYELDDGLELLDVVHLAMIDETDNVLVWMEIGAEKSKYLTGMSIAIAPDGSMLRRVNLNDIYEEGWRRAEY